MVGKGGGCRGCIIYFEWELSQLLILSSFDCFIGLYFMPFYDNKRVTSEMY